MKINAPDASVKYNPQNKALWWGEVLLGRFEEKDIDSVTAKSGEVTIDFATKKGVTFVARVHTDNENFYVNVTRNGIIILWNWWTKQDDISREIYNSMNSPYRYKATISNESCCIEGRQIYWHSICLGECPADIHGDIMGDYTSVTFNVHEKRMKVSYEDGWNSVVIKIMGEGERVVVRPEDVEKTILKLARN